MEYVKANTKVLQDMLRKYDELSSNLDEVARKINAFKSAANSESSSWKSGEYWKQHYHAPNINNYKDKDGEVTSAYYRAKAEASNAATARVNGLVNSYQNILADLPDLNEVKNKVNTVYTILKGVSSLIETFESMATETDYLDLNKVAETLGTGYGVETITIQVDGEEQQVQVLKYEDEDGNKYTISELVNAFYTYTGVTANNAVVLASKDLSGSELESELSGMVNATALGVDNQLQRGFYSVASQASIGAMYEDAMGKAYDETVVKTEYGSILEKNNISEAEYSDALSGLTNSATLGGMAMAGALLVGLNFKLDIPSEKSLETGDTQSLPQGAGPSGGNVPTGQKDDSTVVVNEGGGKATNKDPKPDDEVVNEGGGEATNKDPKPGDEIVNEGQGEPVNRDPKPDEVFPDEDDEPEVLDPDEPEQPVLPVETEVTDEQAKGILDTMKTLEESQQIEAIAKETITSEDIDSQARDQYYSDQEKVIENRTKSYDDYELMTDEERVGALESFGYDHETALKLIEDKNKGQTAYLVGIEEKELSRLSNEIAQNEGISELDHDTKFDDGHNLEYVNSGDIHLDMAMINENVKKAREELTTARYDYDESVTVANNAIRKANTAREDYNNVLEAIKSENGADPKSWTKAQVEEYNKAVTNYNDAVKDAQDKASLVTGKKEIYEREKIEYTQAYREYRNDIRREITEINHENTQPESSGNETTGETNGGTIEVTDEGLRIT